MKLEEGMYVRTEEEKIFKTDGDKIYLSNNKKILKKFNDVTIIFDNKYFALSLFKNKKRKISKNEYKKYAYNRAFNLGLFYIGYCTKSDYHKYSIDFSSNLGMLRFIRR